MIFNFRAYLGAIIISLLLFTGSMAQEYRLVILGNNVDITADQTYLHLRTFLENIDSPYSILLAGDITNSTGLLRYSERLKVVLLGSSAEKIIIIPGDRDWDNSGINGWKNVLALEKAIRKWDDKRVIWPLKNACPGPEYIRINNYIGLIAFNSQWFNHPYDKPQPEDGVCTVATMGDFLEEMKDRIIENGNRNILITGHFPILSHGKYGGYYPLKSWLLPVPIVSGMITSFHQNVGNAKDIVNETFSNARYKIGFDFMELHSAIYISGHEKNLQILRAKDNYFINSGSPEKGDYVASSGHALLADTGPGLITLTFLSNGEVRAAIAKLSGSGYAFHKQVVLMANQCEAHDPGIPSNQAFIPCKEKELAVTRMEGHYPKYTMVVAGPEYEAGGMKKLFLGKHYRADWIQPIQLPFLDLDTVFNGLSAFERGGGRQTKSLKFKGGNGYEYVFRSVNKDPARALPFKLRGTIIEEIIRDQTTTQQPYGAIVADILLNEINILHAHPVLYVMPDDAKLGPFRAEFGNMLGMLEDRQTNPDNKNEKTFAGADKIRKTFKMFNDLFDDYHNEIQTDEFVRARVFDILVGDWGKHEDNWKWAGFDKKGSKGRIYRPVPRDRDHVFSRWDGVLPWLADREWAKQSGENFDYRIKGLRSLMWQARHLDRLVANEMTRTDWTGAAKYIQEHIDAKDIEKAVRAMPAETYDLSGKIIEEKLKSRLSGLPGYAEAYYEMLAKEVDVVGSGKKEYFDVTRNADGSVEVAMYDVMKGEKGKHKLYERTFYPHETREIRLFGLQNDDIFNIHGVASRSILTRVVGGYGNDKIIDESEVRKGDKHTLIYDKEGDNNITMSRETKIINSRNPHVYVYDRTAFQYNTYFPLITLSYNSDEGLLAGLGVTFTNQKYGKPTFSSKHEFKGDVSTEQNYTLDYSSRFHYVFGTWDLLTGGHLGYPNKFNYIYGIGNETVKDDDLYRQKFYRTRYNSTLIRIGILNEFWSRSNFSANFGVEFNGKQLEENNIFSQSIDPVLGEEALDIARGVLILDLDFRDRPNLSTRGMRLFVNHESGWVLNTDTKRYHKIQATVEQFFSLRNESPFTLGLKAGGSATSGDIPYYYRYYLGQLQHLRGYRKNRFTGDKALFLNTNVRWKLGEVRTTIVPLGYGLRGFVDTGRVFESGESSETWHMGYGFGIFLVPIEESFSINITIAFSEEESALLLFSVGKTFN